MNITNRDCWTGTMEHRAGSPTAMREVVRAAIARMKHQMNVSASTPRRMRSSRQAVNAWVTAQSYIAIREWLVCYLRLELMKESG